jgi:hypothetical protein
MSGAGIGGSGASGGDGDGDGDAPGDGDGDGDGDGADAGSAGDGDGDGDADVWRPFSNDSPWNTPIGDDPELDPESAAMIADFETSSPFGERVDVNLQQFSVPMFLADSGTPMVTVRCNLGGLGFSGNDGLMAEALLPMPTDAIPDMESDAHLLIVDRSNNREWGMWHAARSGDQWTCGVGASMDLSGSGARPIAMGNRTWYTSHGPRACGFPLVAGLIRREAIAAGEIPHALVLAYPHIRAGLYTGPASTAQARIGDQAIMSRGIPCGGRVQFDPSIDVESLGLSPAGRAIVVALQRYGAYVGDYSGGVSLYAENSAAAKAEWQGILSDDELAGLDLADFRVLRLGTLYDNGNGN